MEAVSKVFYSIANFFTWILVILCVGGIVISSLQLLGKIADWHLNEAVVGVPSIIVLSIILLVGLITIWMVRRAKASGSSKMWDVLFLILGLIGGNIFYVLGGIFGIIAIRR